MCRQLACDKSIIKCNASEKIGGWGGVRPGNLSGSCGRDRVWQLPQMIQMDRELGRYIVQPYQIEVLFPSGLCNVDLLLLLHHVFAVSHTLLRKSEIW